MIKKAALSLVVIGASGAYVWGQSTTSSGSDWAEASPAAVPADPTAVAVVAAEPPLIVREPANNGGAAATAPLPAPASVTVRTISIDPGESRPAAAPAIRIPAQAASIPEPIKVSAKASRSRRHLSDGAFDGPAIDAFYGMVQIEAVVQNGRLANVKVLRYPSDRRVSIAINRQALPILRREAISAQSANVDIVSGATLTSEAFIESLGAALSQANT